MKRDPFPRMTSLLNQRLYWGHFDTLLLRANSSAALSLPRDRSLPVQPISIRKTQSRKKDHKPLRISWISPKMCLPRLIIIQSRYLDYRVNILFVYPCCVICISFSVHLVWTYYVRKGSWAFFYLNYPQITEVGKFDPSFSPGPGENEMYPGVSFKTVKFKYLV